MERIHFPPAMTGWAILEVSHQDAVTQDRQNVGNSKVERLAQGVAFGGGKAASAA